MLAGARRREREFRDVTRLDNLLDAGLYPRLGLGDPFTRSRQQLGRKIGQGDVVAELG